MRFKKYKVPIYPVRFAIVEAENPKEVFKISDSLKDVFHTKDDLYAHTIRGYIEESGFDKKCIYIVLNRNNQNETLLTHATIAHECTHAVDFVFEIIGETLDDVAEPRTYLLEWFMNQCYEFLGIEKEIPRTKEIKQ